MSLCVVCWALFFTLCISLETILPKRLVPGDTVAFVSPSSPPCQLSDLPYTCPEGFVKSVEDAMAKFGLHVLWGESAFKVNAYLAGTDEERAGDLMKMFLNPSVKAIVATRGGTCSSRMLHLLNFTAIAENPKIFVGYSDITAPHNSIHQMTGLVTFHGPMGIDDWTTNGPFWKSVLMDASAPVLVAPTALSPYTIVPGIARGKLIGGNLVVLLGVMGSKFVPLSAFEGTILFIEEVDEIPSTIDRWLTELSLIGVFDVVAGVVFGQFERCTAPPPTFSLPEILRHHLEGRGVPAFAGAQFGHIHTQWTLPVGLEVEINASAHSISYLSAAVR